MSARAAREPQVCEVGEGGWIVRHTHDVELAARLLHQHLTQEQLVDDLDEARAKWPTAGGQARWIRVTPCLPNSWGAGEGYRFTYGPAVPGTRGAFRCVEWWS